jgi:hypothetical protein
MRKIGILTAALIALSSTATLADPYRMRIEGPEPGPAPSVGCYWMDGERYCSRYCYIEVNGVRYCRDDSPMAAVPQGRPLAIQDDDNQTECSSETSLKDLPQLRQNRDHRRLNRVCSSRDKGRAGSGGHLTP